MVAVWRHLLVLPRLLRDICRRRRAPLGLRVVCLSDTHGQHAQLIVPDGDILVHAGDFTLMGDEDDANSFGAWFGALPHKHKILVHGNHEANAPWAKQTRSLVPSATFLQGSSIDLAHPLAADRPPVVVHGTSWFWPMKSRNPHYEAVTAPCDVLVCHSPCAGRVDGGVGCGELLRLARRLRPRLVVSGHIHTAHGVVERDGGIVFVNAANASEGHAQMGWSPVVVDI